MYLITNIYKIGNDYKIELSWNNKKTELTDKNGLILSDYFFPYSIDETKLIGKVKKFLISTSTRSFIILD